MPQPALMPTGNPEGRRADVAQRPDRGGEGGDDLVGGCAAAQRPAVTGSRDMLAARGAGTDDYGISLDQVEDVEPAAGVLRGRDPRGQGEALNVEEHLRQPADQL
jgi:hypothetical protein